MPEVTASRSTLASSFWFSRTTDEENYRCNICEKIFASKVHVKSHVLSHFGENPFVCNGYERKTREKPCSNYDVKSQPKSEMNSNYDVENQPKPERSLILNYDVKNQPKLKKENQRKSEKNLNLNHDVNNPPKLQKENQEKSEKNLNLNHGVNNPPKLQKNFKFEKDQRKSENNLHLNREENQRASERNLSSCFQESHTDKGHKCETCGKFFSTVGNLNQHKSTHTKDKPFKCDDCGKCFTRRCALKNHMKMPICAARRKSQEDKQRPHVCHVCKWAFKGKYDLKRHLAIHTGERRFQCDVCARRFSRQHSAKVHMKKIHGL